MLCNSTKLCEILEELLGDVEGVGGYHIGNACSHNDVVMHLVRAVVKSTAQAIRTGRSERHAIGKG